MYLLNSALEYARRGWYVFPVTPAKHPLTRFAKGKPGELATRDEAVIRDWFTRRFPEALVAIACGPSNLLVLDEDSYKGGDASSLTLLVGDGSPLPETLTARTPRGGQQYFYAATPEQGSRNTCETLAPGIDTRGRGGMVVAPPAHGREWIGPSRPVVSAPQWLLDALRARHGAPPPATEPGRFSPDDLADALALLDPTDFPTNSEWEPLLMSCHHATGGNAEAREEFVLWSIGDPSFAHDADKIRARWDSLKAGREGSITDRLLIGKVLEVDRMWKPPDERAADGFSVVQIEQNYPTLERAQGGTPKSSFKNALAAVRALDLEPALNEMEDRVYLRGERLPWDHPVQDRAWGTPLLRILREFLIHQFRLELTEEHISNAVETVALERRFNPVAEYLDSCRWDGTPRIDNWLSVYAGAANSPYTRAVARLMLLGAAARAYRPGAKFDTMTILEGQQGAGKSKLLLVLSPDHRWVLEDLSAVADLNDTETEMRLFGKWLVEFPELNAVKRADDVASLKAFLSKQTARLRTPWGRQANDYPRRCVFVGTTNESSYLRDPTGNRRFLPVEVGRIDHGAVERVRDQLWAEAATWWKDDPREQTLVLPERLWATAAAEQEQRMMVDPWEDTIAAHLEERRIDKVHTASLLRDALGITERDQTRSHEQRVSEIMTKLRWRPGKPRVAGTQRRGYFRPGDAPETARSTATEDDPLLQ